MNKLLKQNKLLYFGLLAAFLLIAGVFDLKYEGLFFQLLPDSVQAHFADILH